MVIIPGNPMRNADSKNKPREHLNQSTIEVHPEFLELTRDAGEVGKYLRAIHWETTPVGPFANWPQSLKTALSICLGTKFPMFVWWGPELTVFYNDAYIPLAGPLKHPQFLGKPAREQWKEIWEALRPLTEEVLQNGQSTWAESMQLFVTRKGFLEETYFTFSYSPIRDETGNVGGIINPCQETTARVLSERRLRTLQTLGAREKRASDTAQEVAQHTIDVLKSCVLDVPFAQIYLTEPDGKTARLLSAYGATNTVGFTPSTFNWSDRTFSTTATTTAKKLENLRSTYFVDLPGDPYPERPDAAYSYPFYFGGSKTPAGLLVLGISPRLSDDALYRGFLDLVAKQVANQFSAIQAWEEEKLRRQALADLDRAKTAFFSNVSHEFRTPLTLLLAPCEELLSGTLSAEKTQDSLKLIHRNALRLQKLVNSLLDFSRLESGRMQFRKQLLDLSKLTAEIASSFETVMSQAGLSYHIHCDPIPREVAADPDLWEKIVLNLISNALKFTPSGSITVRFTAESDGVVLEVTDTGVGIPEQELPRIFERFYRVENPQSRTYEGSGIGLSLVEELTRLHGGEVEVISQVGRGTSFVVRLPYGTLESTHTVEKLEADQAQGRTKSPRARAFVEEAYSWNRSSPVALNPETRTHAPSSDRLELLHTDGERFKILLVDDNRDMRDYVRRRLVEGGKNWDVQVATQGQEAYDLAKIYAPDLILSDVMMPVLDGFGLLKAIREDAVLQTTPVVLLSARAGEDTTAESIERGADDYLVKPFSTRELLARVNTHLEMSRMRKSAAQQAQSNIAKNQFLANMSHELRTPLGAVLGFAEIMLSQDTSAEERAECLKAIIKNGHQVTRVVNEILDLSKIESERLEIQIGDLSLTDLIDDVTAVMNMQAQDKGIRLTVLFEGPIPKTIRSDVGRLKQILLNLLGNAIKFTESGEITLLARYRLADRRLEFSVKDTGIGMSREQQKLLFQRFTQVDSSMTRRYGGTGLGLIVSKKLAQALGGDLTLVKSAAGEGTEFSFVIPNQTQDPLTILPSAARHATESTVNIANTSLNRQPSSVAPAQNQLNTLDILLVDDSPDNRILVGRMLKAAGANVTYAEDGEVAVRTALAKDFDIVLMDLQMPKKDGFEALAELRAKSFAKPIIALTAHNMKGDRERCLACGFNDHVSKPVNRAHLLQTIVGLAG